MPNSQALIHIFVDHSNMWGSARLASRIRTPTLSNDHARVNVSVLDHLLGGTGAGIVSKIVSGGVPPGMEGLWLQYQANHYDTQRLFRDEHWKERGVDHTIIGHMWRIACKHVPDKGEARIVLASGDGHRNEFGTSFLEVVEEILLHERYAGLKVKLASFDWQYSAATPHRSPTNQRLKQIVEKSDRGEFVNLMQHYDKLVYHEKETVGNLSSPALPAGAPPAAKVAPAKPATPSRRTSGARRAPQYGRR